MRVFDVMWMLAGATVLAVGCLPDLQLGEPTSSAGGGSSSSTAAGGSAQSTGGGTSSQGGSGNGGGGNGSGGVGGSTSSAGGSTDCGAVCNCGSGEQCNFTCAMSPCDVTCSGASTCTAECAAATCSCQGGSTCNFTCTDAPCQVNCTQGSSCVVDCGSLTPGMGCDIQVCQGGSKSTCSDNKTIVCNASCPN